MVDIVERLRLRGERVIKEDQWGKIVSVDNDALEAADEIERLRKQCEFEKKCRNDAYDELKQQDAEIERLREKYEKLLGASVDFQIAIHNALFAFEKTVDDIQQKESE